MVASLPPVYGYRDIPMERSSFHSLTHLFVSGSADNIPTLSDLQVLRSTFFTTRKHSLASLTATTTSGVCPSATGLLRVDPGAHGPVELWGAAAERLTRARRLMEVQTLKCITYSPATIRQGSPKERLTAKRKLNRNLRSNSRVGDRPLDGIHIPARYPRRLLAPSK